MNHTIDIVKNNNVLKISNESYSSNKEKNDKIHFFQNIIGYDDIKKIFKMSLNSDKPVHILLVGPPASAKTLFML